MRINECIGCELFPCQDVKHDRYVVPGVEIDPEAVSIFLISEAAPDDHQDYYYAGENALFEQTTVQAFKDAGAEVNNLRDVLDLGVYLTTAVKCGKTDYTLKARTIETCSYLLEAELDLFPNVQVYLLMGDAAIKAVNYISKRAGKGRSIRAGSTYKIRGEDYYFRGRRAFPSYVQAGPSFFIEKSKRRMIAEDIAAALDLVS